MACRHDVCIHNNSDCPMKLIPISLPDGVPASCGMVRPDLALVIPAQGCIYVNSRKYNMNGNATGAQIRIHFVATNGRRVRVRPENQTDDVGPVFLHYELRTYRQIYLTCEEGEEVTTDERP